MPSGTGELARSPVSALFWRVFVVNALVFVVGMAMLVVSPAPVSLPVSISELVVLAGGLALMLAANALLLRASLRPLDGLTDLMKRVDLLRPGARALVTGNGDVAHLIHTFNEMLDRLEAERGASAARALAAQEGERQRIAQELHDEIGQTADRRAAELKAHRRPRARGTAEGLRAVQDITRGSLDEVRQVARRLRPGVLDDLGLSSALTRWPADFTTTSQVPTPPGCDERLPRLDPAAELVIYRIAQEGLTNVARHAGARHAELSLSTAGPDLVAAGRATTGEASNGAPEGAGIRGMRERAILIGADLTIGPTPSGGTEVRLRGPAPRSEITGCSQARRGSCSPTTTRWSGEVYGSSSTANPTSRWSPRQATAPKPSRAPRSGEVDLAILDIAMPRMTGLQAARELARRAPTVRLLMLSMYDNEQYFFEALKAGACGYVLKSVADRDLRRGLPCRDARRTVPLPGRGHRPHPRLPRRSRAGDALPDSILTRREEEIVKLIAEGHSSKEIADTLVISIKTVERHRANILQKLGLHDRLDLTRYAIRAGLVEP